MRGLRFGVSVASGLEFREHRCKSWQPGVRRATRDVRGVSHATHKKNSDRKNRALGAAVDSRELQSAQLSEAVSTGALVLVII